jgi:hypothetical protein
LRALEGSIDLVVKRIFLECFLLTTQCVEEVCIKLNGMLNVPLNTIDLGGGIQKALTFIECFQDHSRGQESLRYPKCILDFFSMFFPRVPLATSM